MPHCRSEPHGVHCTGVTGKGGTRRGGGRRGFRGAWSGPLVLEDDRAARAETASCHRAGRDDRQPRPPRDLLPGATLRTPRTLRSGMDPMDPCDRPDAPLTWQSRSTPFGLGPGVGGREVPELPEVEALARSSTGRVAGRHVERCELGAIAALKTVDPPLSSLVGAHVASVTRRGKYLCMDLDGTWLVHAPGPGGLGASGRTSCPPSGPDPAGAPWPCGSGSSTGVGVRRHRDGDREAPGAVGGRRSRRGRGGRHPRA